MKTKTKLTLTLIALVIVFVSVGICYFCEDYKEQKELEEFVPNENVPEFMKNGEWLDIVLNGYNGQK